MADDLLAQLDVAHVAAAEALLVAEASDRDSRDDLLQYIRRHRAHHIGIDVAGRYGIDGNVLGGGFERQRLGKTDQRRFGG